MSTEGTKRIQSPQNQKASQGFLSWFSEAVFEQREIGPLISIGRDSSQTITLNDPFISRRHARIERKQDGIYILKDISSRNGTFLNGNKVFQALLKNNDRIRIGRTEMTFSFTRFKGLHNLSNKSLNPEWSKNLARLPSMAQTDFPILILGPSGSGKEHLAHTLHSLSSRNSSPYVSVNCSALTETLAESEFFGHIRGAYTGADQSRKGAFLAADGGTLFLDEVGDLPLTLQPKLLRALEYKEIKPVGADRTLKVNVRIIAATHQNLQEKVLAKEFREDLYFRLRVLEVNPPALKDRMEDFDLLLNSFAAKLGVAFSKQAVNDLKKHSWPGNIRELKNTLARAKALFYGTVIKSEHIKDIVDPLYESPSPSRKEKLPLLKHIEKEVITKILQENQGNQKRAALQLDMPRTTLNEKIKTYGISPKK